MTNEQHSKGWYARGYIPHFDAGPVPQIITFRLVDSFPMHCLERWAEELEAMSPAKAELERRCRIEEYLDKGAGSAWLAQPEVAEIMSNALSFFDGTNYRLHAWVVMPNHVHVLLTLGSGENLARILHSWKSFTALKANAMLGRSGPFWQREYFDRFVRSQEHFAAAVEYIECNPVKARLCVTPEQWRYSSASLTK
jgi:REP element-mobilizing transposase RayT